MSTVRRFAPALGLLVAGCLDARPQPVKLPPPVMGTAFAELPVGSIDPVPDDWWRLFDDPVLDRLVQASLAANADLRVAYANLDGARAAQRLADAARLPQPVIESSLGVDNPSVQPSAANVSNSDYDVAATVSWDVDLFGRLRWLRSRRARTPKRRLRRWRRCASRSWRIPCLPMSICAVRRAPCRPHAT